MRVKIRIKNHAKEEFDIKILFLKQFLQIECLKRSQKETTEKYFIEYGKGKR